MANTKISQLPVATTPLTGSELVPIVQGGVTKNVAAQNVVTPGGSTTQIQYNNAGAFAGATNVTYDGTNVKLGATGALQFADTDSSNYVAFKAPAIIGSNVTWTLPNTDGAPNETLITNGSGVLSWATPTLTPTAPTNNTLPVVTGTPTVGQTLQTTTGTWSGYPAPAYSYQWIRGAATNVGTNSSSYTLVDADYNNTIKCTVTATNGAGTASATSAATAAVAGTVPGAPTIGTATPGNAQVSVAFTAPAVTGGPAITSYTATSNDGITGTGSSSPVIVSGLTNGTAYTFTVTATNSIGTGAASAASNSVTPTAVVQDPSFTYVPLLLETTSTNGQNNQGTTTTNGFLDSSTNNFTITRSGSTTQGSVTPYWPNGQWSNYFPGGANDYFNIGTQSILNVGTGNFTIECFIFFPGRSAALSRESILAPTEATLASGVLFQLNGSTQGLTGISATVAGTTISSATAISANTWHHVAVVRSSGVATIYVDGTSRASGTAAGSLSNAASYNIASLRTTDPQYNDTFQGYISNFRTTSTAVYSGSTITVPTAPLSPSTANQTLLTCYSNRFIDANTATTAKTITVNGTPLVQAFQPFSPAAAYTPAAYGGSGLFNGSTDYLTTPSNAAFAIGTGDFTIEGWVYPTAAFTTNVLFAVAITNGLTLYITGGNLIVRAFDTADLLSSATIPALNAWTHIAVTRSGTNLRIFVNGFQTASTTNSTSFAQGQAVVAAGSAMGSAPWVGYVSNFRLVKGTPVYTGNFTPPTLAPLTTAGSTSAASYPSTNNVNTSFAAANTSLLLNFTNAGIYDAAAQNLITTAADAQVSTTITAKWPPTSMKFDGTLDALSMTSSTSFGLGTGNWTIEFWVYLNALTTQNLVSMLTSLASVAPHIYYSVAGGVRYYTNGADRITGGALTTGVWNYIAVTKSSGVTRMYINGTQTGSNYTDANNYGTANPFSVGGYGVPLAGTDTLNGYVQDVRITKGVARSITANPAAPFPVQ